jgi:tape measure domain-containing protein
MATIRDRYILDVDTKGATQGLAGFQSKLAGIGRFAGFGAIAAGLTGIASASLDASKRMQPIVNQLRLITNGADELTATMNTLTGAARANRASFADTADLFTKLTLATEGMGKSQEEILLVTQKFQQAVAISGADAGTAAGAIRQFGQAMASGTVRGDEFNSIVEALGPALNIMGRETGINVGQLREMSQAGQLTADTFFDMLSSSNAITQAFEQTTATSEQLETALGDAFDRVKVSIANNLGITKAYNIVLQSLIDTADRLSNNQAALINMSPEKMFEAVSKNAADAEQAINILEERMGDLVRTTGNLSGAQQGEISIPTIPDDVLNAELQSYLDTINALKELMDERQKAADQKAKEAKANAEAAAAVTEVRNSYSGYITELKKYAAIDNRSEVEKLNDAQAKSLEVIDALITAQSSLNLSTEQGRKEFEIIAGHIENSKIAYETFGQKLTEVNNIVNESSFDIFFNDLIEGARQSATEQTNVALAIQRLKDELDAGKISLDVFAQGMVALGQNTVDTTNKLDQLAQAGRDALQSMEDRVRLAEESAELSSLEGVARELRAIELEERRLADAAKARIQEQFKGVDDAELQKQLAAIDAQTQATITQRQAAAQTVASNKAIIDASNTAAAASAKLVATVIADQKKAQRTFSDGWKDAYKEYTKAATNAADRGAKAFGTFTQGAEDAIVNFVKTGKLSFRDLISDLLEQSLRANIQGLFSGIFNPGSKTGGKTEDIFAGFFANGGLIPSGKFGVVGENGPELVSGPAQVTPMNGGGNVTYNISAVDALSFKQLVARDPGFIHAVANKGGRAVPSRR